MQDVFLPSYSDWGAGDWTVLWEVYEPARLEHSTQLQTKGGTWPQTWWKANEHHDWKLSLDFNTCCGTVFTEVQLSEETTTGLGIPWN